MGRRAIEDYVPSRLSARERKRNANANVTRDPILAIRGPQSAIERRDYDPDASAWQALETSTEASVVTWTGTSTCATAWKAAPIWVRTQTEASPRSSTSFAPVL